MGTHEVEVPYDGELAGWRRWQRIIIVMAALPAGSAAIA
jgi:hypothetical protein